MELNIGEIREIECENQIITLKCNIFEGHYSEHCDDCYFYQREYSHCHRLRCCPMEREDNEYVTFEKLDL